VVGLTATPYRLDSGYLHEGKGAIFDGIAHDIPVAMLMDQGYLSPVISKGGIKQINLEGVGKRGGEFIEHRSWQLLRLIQSLVNVYCRGDRAAWSRSEKLAGV
jgi:superfamily II DNA or RNA helicase